MITSRSELIYRLETYKTDFAEEAPFTKQFLELLTAPTCYYRDHLPGHITGSSWVVNQRKDHVLLLLHGKLADDQEPLLISEESHQLAWIKIEDLVHQTQGNESIRRMYEKTKGLF
ncbi:MAG: hypothetical protein OEU76_03820 [Cyclobacteriaceae bacterium]|nr:hypothetical protein [Cyclobacteriaceae bacterium]